MTFIITATITETNAFTTIILVEVFQKGQIDCRSIMADNVEDYCVLEVYVE